MKRIITGCLLLNFAMAAQAECNISSSIQNIDYGKRSAAMRQVDRGKTTQLADRTITLVMQCDQDAHIRVGSHSVNRLSTQHYTQIGTRNTNMTITCESATGIAITARDTRMDSMTTGKDSGGQSGVKYTLNGGGYISQTTRLFGLGKTKDNKNIGSYAVLIDSNNISASNGSQTLAVSIAGADAVITGQKRAWQALTAYPLAVDQSYYYTFVKPGETTPTPVTNAIIPLQVSASIANDLGGSEKIELDGKAVISVVYL